MQHAQGALTRCSTQGHLKCGTQVLLYRAQTAVNLRDVQVKVEGAELRGDMSVTGYSVKDVFSTAN